jgi:hypothetical protein
MVGRRECILTTCDDVWKSIILHSMRDNRSRWNIGFVAGMENTGGFLIEVCHDTQLTAILLDMLAVALI